MIDFSNQLSQIIGI